MSRTGLPPKAHRQRPVIGRGRATVHRRVVRRAHAFMQNIRRGHYELGVDTRVHRRVARAFGELSRAI